MPNPANRSPIARRSISGYLTASSADAQGDDVSWKWGSSHPEGKVADIVTEGKAEVTSKKGNVISKNASEDDPAVVIERDGVSFAAASSRRPEWIACAGFGLTRRTTRSRGRTSSTRPATRTCDHVVSICDVSLVPPASGATAHR